MVSALNLAVPAPIATGRLLWLAADSGVVTDSNGKVSSWSSQGNSVITVNQTDTNRRPTLIADAINGKPALRFANRDMILSNTALGAQGDAFIGDIQAFAVYTTRAADGRYVMRGVITGGAEWMTGQGFAIVSPPVGTDFPADVPILGKAGGENVEFSTRLGNLSIGDYEAGRQYGLSGDIAEILVYKPLSRLGAAEIENYLRSKYGIKPKTAVVNGSFEDHVVAGYKYAQYTPGSGGWIHANYSIVQANGSAWSAPNAPNGTQTGVLQGYGKQLGVMSQTIDFIPGDYTVSLKAARRSGQIQPVKISLDGTQIGALITPASDAFADFTTVSFRASAGFHTLRLEATDGTADKSTFIDQIVINSLGGGDPPPSTGTTVFDDSFEAPVVNGYQYNPTGSTWNFMSRAVIQSNSSAWGAATAPDGIQTAVLQGAPDGIGHMTRALSLTAGSYTLSFKAARRWSQTQPIKFSVDGVQVGALISPTSDSFLTYTASVFTVTAGNHTLKLEATDGSGDKSTFLDQVKLVRASTSPTTVTVNGNFEAPVVNGYQYNPTGSGWSFTSNSVIQSNGSAWGAATAPEGVQTAVLQGAPSGLGTISQTVTLAAGNYTLSFKAARRWSQTQPVKFSVDGVQVGTLISPTSDSFLTYTASAFTVTAGNHTLKLEATDGSGDKSIFLDQIMLMKD